MEDLLHSLLQKRERYLKLKELLEKDKTALMCIEMFDEILEEITFDFVFPIFKEQTFLNSMTFGRHSTPTDSGDHSITNPRGKERQYSLKDKKEVFGNTLNVSSQDRFPCDHCKQIIHYSRYAPHLERCMLRSRRSGTSSGRSTRSSVSASLGISSSISRPSRACKRVYNCYAEDLIDDEGEEEEEEDDDDDVYRNDHSEYIPNSSGNVDHSGDEEEDEEDEEEDEDFNPLDNAGKGIVKSSKPVKSRKKRTHQKNGPAQDYHNPKKQSRPSKKKSKKSSTESNKDTKHTTKEYNNEKPSFTTQNGDSLESKQNENMDSPNRGNDEDDVDKLRGSILDNDDKDFGDDHDDDNDDLSSGLSPDSIGFEDLPSLTPNGDDTSSHRDEINMVPFGDF